MKDHVNSSVPDAQRFESRVISGKLGTSEATPLADTLAIFRRDRRAGDELPLSLSPLLDVVVDAIQHASPRFAAASPGVPKPQQSRLALSAAIGKEGSSLVYLLPTDRGGICIAAPAAVGLGGITCLRSLLNHVAFVVAKTATDRVVVAGVASDDVHSVKVLLADGTADAAALGDNAFFFETSAAVPSIDVIAGVSVSVAGAEIFVPTK